MLHESVRAVEGGCLTHNEEWLTAHIRKFREK